MPLTSKLEWAFPHRLDRPVGRVPWLAVLFVVSQLAILVVTQVTPLLGRIWRLRFASALVRSAQLSYGAGFTDYVLFLRRVVPEEALVVVPSLEADPVLGEMPFMQYFLFPRRLTNCPTGAPWSKCLINYGGPQTYIMAVRSFPPRSGLEGLKEYVPFDELRGVYVPPQE
jgi:hypothetical protein